MTEMDPEASRRISVLTEQIDTLTTQNRRLRAIFDREIFPRRQSWSEKLRPKIGSYYHYPARELQVPLSSVQGSLPDPVPSFAIVTPSYNQGHFIAATIDSVLAQNYPALRYHVQDAGSCDQTNDVLTTYDGRISWRSEPDRGQAHGINVGFRAVSGDIMAYLNSDDVLLPGALAHVARAFAVDPDLDFVYGHRICIDENGLEIGRWILPPHDRTAIKWFDFIPQETLFWRRRALEKLGGFNENLQHALDWDFILRAHAEGMRFCRLPRFLACFRVHDLQKTTDSVETGRVEVGRLRRTHLGFDPEPRMVSRATRRYLRRHVLFHRLYKLKVLTY